MTNAQEIPQAANIFEQGASEAVEAAPVVTAIKASTAAAAETAAAPVCLTYAEVEYLMSLCLTTDNGSVANNDALLGKLALAWRRHYRMA